MDSIGSGVSRDSRQFVIALLVAFVIITVVMIIHQYVYKIVEQFEPLPTFNDTSISQLSYDPNLFKLGSVNYNGMSDDYVKRAVQAEKDKIDLLSNRIIKNQTISQKLKDKLINDSMPKPFPIDKPIQTIKSIYNSQILTLEPIDTKYYFVQINDKCLTVYGDNDYLIKECESSSISYTSQAFYHERINGATDAKRVTGKNPLNDATYPYSMFKSLVTDHALTSSDGGITLEPCNPDNPRQRWQISPDLYNC